MVTHKVLIPLDGSAFSRQILPYVRKFLPPENTGLILLQVAPSLKDTRRASPVEQPHELQLPQQVVDYPYWPDTPPPYAAEEFPLFESQEWEGLQAAFEDAVAAEVEGLQEAGYAVSVVTRLGDPVAEILACIQEELIDLVAMTTHGRSGLNLLLYGSVAAEVMRHAPVPVLLLRPVQELPAPESLRLVHG